MEPEPLSWTAVLDDHQNCYNRARFLLMPPKNNEQRELQKRHSSVAKAINTFTTTATTLMDGDLHVETIDAKCEQPLNCIAANDE